MKSKNELSVAISFPAFRKGVSLQKNTSDGWLDHPNASSNLWYHRCRTNSAPSSPLSGLPTSPPLAGGAPHLQSLFQMDLFSTELLGGFRKPSECRSFRDGTLGVLVWNAGRLSSA